MHQVGARNFAVFTIGAEFGSIRAQKFHQLLIFQLFLAAGTHFAK